MGRRIYIFNPENDLAVANGGENYMAPPLARCIATDLALLPLWYAGGEGDTVLVPSSAYKDWMCPERERLGVATRVQVAGVGGTGDIDGCVPWGWSPEIVRRLSRWGVPDHCLPAASVLERQRLLSHRNMTCLVLNEMRDRGVPGLPGVFPAELFTAAEVRAYLESAPFTVLKAPWSGSGKGLSWGRGVLDETLDRWSRGILKRQGSVMGEPFYNKVRDFAMEFCSDGNQVSFAGYSLFSTNKKGVYEGNILAGSDRLEAELLRYVPGGSLPEVRDALADILTKYIAPYYRGYLGVDMMIYNDDGVYRLHPCVEINLRMNMGMAARLIYDRHISPGSVGTYTVDYFPEAPALTADHRERLRQKPLVIENGKIRSGYLSLCPVLKDTRYRARVEVKAF